jgi:hypothetical protein
LDGAEVQAIREVTRTAATCIEPFASIDVSLLILADLRSVDISQRLPAVVLLWFRSTGSSDLGFRV